MHKTPRRNTQRLLSAIALVLFTPFARAEFTTPTAITHVELHGARGVIVKDATILMDGRRIVALGSDIDVPATAEIIDGTGLHAYPGFIDAFSHFGLPDEKRTEKDRQLLEDANPDPREDALAMTRAANRRGILPQFKAWEAYAPPEKDLTSLREAGFTAALIAPRYGILGGTSDLIALGDAPRRRSVLAPHVALHASFSAGEPGDYPRTVMGAIAQYRQVLLDAQWHARMLDYAGQHPLDGARLPDDPALDALQPALAGKTRIFFEADSEREIRRAFRLAEEFELSVGIVGGAEAYKIIDLFEDKNIPLIVRLKFDEEPEYGKKDKKKTKQKPSEKKSEQSEPEEKKTDQAKKDKKKDEEKIYEPLKVRKERRRLWEEQVANVIRLHEAGVPFALTTDGLKTSEFFKNLRTVIDRGLPEHAAIHALSAQAADVCGLGDRLGTVTPNRVANLTIRTGPLTDEKAKTKYVFVDGKKFTLDHDDEKDDKKEKDDEKEEESQQEPDEKETPPREVVDDPRPEKTPGEAPQEVTPKVEPTVPPKPPEETPPAGEETTEPEKPDEEEVGPTWTSEIKADRIPATQTGGNCVITNATVIPVTSDTLENASILVRDGKIEAIGADIAIPDEFTVIDATGRFVMPGIVDAHSHLGIDSVNESANAVSAEVRIADVINPTSTAIYRALAGGATTHHAMHGSANPIGGQCVVFKLKYERPVEELLIDSAPVTIKFALGENVIQSNWERAWGRRYPNTRMGVEATMRQALTTAQQYKKKWNEYESAGSSDAAPPRRDLRLEALAAILSGDITVHSHCYRSDEILRLIAVAEDFGFRIGTFHHVLEGYRIAPEIARHGSGASTFANDWAYKLEAYGATPYNTALMTEHGVNVSINSDSPNTIRFLGQEAAKCIKWGSLNENEALRLITMNAAQQLEIDDRVGSIEVGKDADFAIFNGHPLNSFSKCVMTLIDGEVYFEDDDPEPVEDASARPFVPRVDRTTPESSEGVYAILGATVHTISGDVIDNGVVVIQDGRIEAVGNNVVVPTGAGRINATGLHVYPGLIDGSSTVGLAEIGSLRATRDNREIGEYNAHLRAISAVHPHSVHVGNTRTAGTTTALIEPSGGRIAGQSAIIHLDGWTMPEMLVDPEFAMHLSVPYLPPNIPEKDRKKRKEAYDKELREITEFLDRAKHYAKISELAATDASIEFEADLGLQAMVPYVRGEKPVIVGASDDKHILDVLEFAEKHGLKLIISGGRESWKVADKLAEKEIPVILGTVLSYPRGEFEEWDSVYRCASVLDKAGVAFCFASDSYSNAYDLGTNAGMAVAHGLPKERAEYALTLGAAKVLGIDDRYGSIEIGKQANLIVTTDSPAQTFSQVTHMFVDGKPVDLTSYHKELYDRFRNRPAPSLPPEKELIGPPSLTRPTS